jgi:4'-phosphopantetheinyl transferase
VYIGAENMNVKYMDVSELESKNIFDTYMLQMSTYRQEKINTLKFDRDKELSLGAGILLMKCLKEYGIEESRCKYKVAEHGRPYISEYDFSNISESDNANMMEHKELNISEHDNIEFNLSHSGRIAAIAIDNTIDVNDVDNKNGDICDIENYQKSESVFDFGIDVEQIKKYSQNVVNRIFSEKDKNIMSDLQNEDTEQAEKYFARVWTRIESYGKMTGKGVVFSDGNLKHVMDDEYMADKNIYFKEYEVTDRENNRYIISLCGKTKDIMYCNLEEITI